MALSESGLYAAGVMPGPMIYGPKGHRITVKPKSGPASAGKVRAGGKQPLYVRSRSSRKGGRR